MVLIELTKQQVESYNNGEQVFIIDNEFVELYVTKNKELIYSKRVDNKKYGCYMLNIKDVNELNNGNQIHFYNGRCNIYLKNDTGVNLE